MSRGDPEPDRVALPDEAATARLAQDLARGIACPALIALWGDLGAGKTSFARAFIRACANDPLLDVPSPTFTLVQGYDTARGPLWHYDLYRLEQPEDAEELGLFETLGESIVLIEWPERLGALLPERRLDISLTLSQGGWSRMAEIGRKQT